MKRSSSLSFASSVSLGGNSFYKNWVQLKGVIHSIGSTTLDNQVNRYSKKDFADGMYNPSSTTTVSPTMPTMLNFSSGCIHRQL